MLTLPGTKNDMILIEIILEWHAFAGGFPLDTPTHNQIELYATTEILKHHKDSNDMIFARIREAETKTALLQIEGAVYQYGAELNKQRENSLKNLELMNRIVGVNPLFKLFDISFLICYYWIQSFD